MFRNSLDNRRILIIDDNPAIFEDFRKVLATEAIAPGLADLEASLFGEAETLSVDAPAVYELDYAQQGEEGLAKLTTARAVGQPYAMAFVDMRMPPGWDGVETIRHLWGEDPDLQIVIATAYSDYSPEEITKSVGRSDRLLMLRKPFEAAEVRQLAASMTSKWNLNRRRSVLEAMVAERTADLERAALADALTGLPNRTLFYDRLTVAINQTRRDPSRKFAVLFLDFDRFKLINDSLGHEAGDELLRSISKRLTGALRDVDTVATATESRSVTARLGGDEFVLLLDHIQSDVDAARVADRLIETLSTAHVIGGREVYSFASVGITTSGLGYESAEEMVRDADTAMYRAKRAGGSRYVMFDQGMHVESVERLTLEVDLRQALARGEFSLHYQPIVKINGQRLTGFEALLRWQHPRRGNVPPTEFVPIAEETGVIVPLGLWVVEQACRQLAKWQKTIPGMPGLTVSVNLSRKQVSAADLVDRIAQILQETGIAPGSLKMEVTETAIMHDPKTATRVFNELRKLGVQLHMDDFGTGQSSLSCLQQFPLNGLKIDRDFVQSAMRSPEDAAIIRTIVLLAENLSIPLVAEGIETVEQMAMLQKLGCVHAQGFLVSKPMDAEHATAYIREEGLGSAAA